ncbi:MAG: mandelate racemase/muconate lactonizing enzyme family protein [Beijerinckiaceae bacterium]
MEIAHVEAYALKPMVPVRGPGFDRMASRSLVLVEVKTKSGLTGYGTTGLAPPDAVIGIINRVAAPLIMGMDSRRISYIWDILYRELGHRGQTGFAYHALSAIDVALWDVRGKALSEPVWRLLGGSREKVPCYVTCGLPSFDREQLAASAKDWVAQGFGGVKIVVGVIARDRAHEFPNMTAALREDAERIRAIREALGEGVDIAIDINCELDAQQALALARLCAPYDVAFIEEPMRDNDPEGTADFRRRSGMQVAAGQSMGGLPRFRELLRHRAVDILQPNVVNCGGYTGGLRAAALALSYQMPIGNGGGSTAHNLHLQAGVINGTVCEWHPYQSAGAMAVICPSAPVPVNGWLSASERPGLGFDPDPNAVREFRVKG